MNYLLDTHTFLWSLFDPEKLSKPVAKTIVSQKNDVAVSVITFWEISLKYSIGKLELYGIEPDEIPYCAEQMDVSILPVDSSEAASFHKLPRLKHKDPFDRLIIWQAIQRKIILISKDRSFKDYGKFGLKIHW
jgi:PIN domain nuclease of toxin-antitoxin system